MTNESKFCDEICHRRSGEAEFLAVAEGLGIEPSSMVDPRTEMSFAVARRRCGKCTSKEKCRQTLGKGLVRLSEVARFCPATDVFVDLLRRQLSVLPIVHQNRSVWRNPLLPRSYMIR